MPGVEIPLSSPILSSRETGDRRPEQDVGVQIVGPAPGATTPRPSVLHRFKVNDECFLRINLSPGSAGDPRILRGAQGNVHEVGAPDFSVKVYFHEAERYVRCQPHWLEAWPGEIVRGVCRIWATQRHPMYDVGMLVTDLKFPKEADPCYPRFCTHRRRLMRSGLGFSFYDGVDATNARWALERVYHRGASALSHIGLILREEIWPRDRRQWRQVSEFHAAVARSLMGQWSSATCVMVLRDTDARNLSRELGHVKRISYHYNESFQLHYVPLILDLQEPARGVKGVAWCAAVIRPKFGEGLVGANDRVTVPGLVLKAMCAGQATLQLCAYTCESTLAIMQYLLEVKRLHRLPDQ